MSGISAHTFVRLAWRDFWRHPKVGSGGQGRVRGFLLNYFPPIMYLLALSLLVFGTYFILGIRLATNQQYDRELSNPFVWWVSVMRDLTSEKGREGAGAVLPAEFWDKANPYLRYGLHLIPAGGGNPVRVRGRTFNASDPVVRAAAQSLVWPVTDDGACDSVCPDRRKFLADAEYPAAFGIVITKFMYTEILGNSESDLDELPYLSVAHWTDYGVIPIPVLGVVEYLPGGEFLIGEWFAKAFIARTWRLQLFPQTLTLVAVETAVASDADDSGMSRKQLDDDVEQVSLALEEAGLQFEGPEIFGMGGRPAMQVRFSGRGAPRGDLVEILALSPDLASRYEVRMGSGNLNGSAGPINYNRTAYVLKPDIGLISRMLEYSRREGLVVDSSVLIRSTALMKGQEHFERQSRLVLVVNWAAALALLTTVVAYKTHKGIRGFGIYLALGGKPVHGFMFQATQFCFLFMLFSTTVALIGGVTAAQGVNVLRLPLVGWSFVCWDISFFVYLLLLAGIGLAVIATVRWYTYRSLWPSDMIHYRE